MPVRSWSRAISAVRLRLKGNTQHPASLGGTDIFTQAALLGMYDPDRSQNVISMGDQRSWQAFVNVIQGPLNAQKSLQGRGHSYSDRNHYFADAGRSA